MGNQYFVRKRDEVMGPWSVAELKELAAAGELEPWHQISKDAKSWTAAGLFSGLEFPLDTTIDRPFDVFISYSTRNAAEAQAVCTRFEQSGLRCWIAPRDLLPGAKWSEGVITGLEQSRAMLVILSREANDSPQVQREAERATSKARTVMFFPLDDVAPSGPLEAALEQASWRDACDLPWEKRVGRLTKVAGRMLRTRGVAPPSAEPTPEPEEEPEERPAALVALFTGAHAALLATAAAMVLVIGLAAWWFYRSEGAAGATPTDEKMRPTSVSGRWSLDGDELVQSDRTSAAFAVVIFGDPEWSRYDLSLKVKVVGGEDCVAVRFHVQDPGTYRKFQLGPSERGAHVLSTYIHGKYDKYDHKIRTGILEKDQWHDVRVEVRGPACRCWLDGVLWFSGEHPRFTKGRIALGTKGTQARFRDIEVKSEDGKTTLWKGNPLL